MTIGKRWIIVFLLLFGLSLGINLFSGGLLLGRHVFQRTAGPEAVVTRPAVRRFLQTVPKEARPVLRRHFRDNGVEIVGYLRAIRDARAHVAEVLAQPKLDEAALADAFARLRARTTALQAFAHGIMTEAAKELPPEVRAKLQANWKNGGFLGRR